MERPTTFLWQTRVRGRGRLALSYWRRHPASSSRAAPRAGAGEGNPARCVYFAPCGYLGQRGALGVCAGAVCQVAGSPGNPPSAFDSFFLGGSGTAGADARALRPIRVILRQVRQGCLFGGCFFSVALAFLPSLSLAWQASSPGQDGLAAAHRTL